MQSGLGGGGLGGGGLGGGGLGGGGLGGGGLTGGGLGGGGLGGGGLGGGGGAPAGRLDVITENAGENVRRVQARDLGASVVQAIFRLVKQSTLHSMDNQAVVRQVEDSTNVINDYGQRTDQNVSILFAYGSIFVGGQLLKANRQTYEGAMELGEILKKFGFSELAIAKNVAAQDLFAFVSAIGEAQRAGRTQNLEKPSQRIRLRAVAESALKRGAVVERLEEGQAVVRAYASAIVIMRRFFESLKKGRYDLPQRVKRISQSLVDLSAGETPAFLGVTAARNANHDEAGKAVNTAILAVSIARQVSDDIILLGRVAMAALLYDIAKPRLTGAMGPNAPAIMPRLSDAQELEVPAATAAVLTALGRVNEPSVMRTVMAYEAHWYSRSKQLGALYRGLRQVTLQARIISIARRFNDLLTPAPGADALPADEALAQLEADATDQTDHTVIRLLVGALGIFPTGTLVQVGSGEMGLVYETHAHPSKYSMPKVRLWFDANGGQFPQPVDVDLSTLAANDPRKQIQRIVSPADDNSRAQAKAARQAAQVQPVQQGGPQQSALGVASPGRPRPNHTPTNLDYTPASNQSYGSSTSPSGTSPSGTSPSGTSSPFTPSSMGPRPAAAPLATPPPGQMQAAQPSRPQVTPQPFNAQPFSPAPHTTPQPGSFGNPAPQFTPQPGSFGGPAVQMTPAPGRAPVQHTPAPGMRAPTPAPEAVTEEQAAYEAEQRAYQQRLVEYQKQLEIYNQQLAAYQAQQQQPAPAFAPEAGYPAEQGYPVEQTYSDPGEAAPPSGPGDEDGATRAVAWGDQQASVLASMAGGGAPPQEAIALGPQPIALGPQPIALGPSPSPAPPGVRAGTPSPQPGALRAPTGELKRPPTAELKRPPTAELKRPPTAEIKRSSTGEHPAAPVEPEKPAVSEKDLSPTAEGNLTKTPLVHLLVYMLDQRLTGTTLFQTPEGVNHGIYFDKGVPAKVRTGAMVYPLDRVLLEMGLLDEVTLRDSLMEISKKNILHGRYLVSKGLVDGATIMKALKLQLVRKLVHLFDMSPETKYSFYADVNLLENYGGPELIGCEPLSILMVGVRLRGDDPLVDQTLNRLQKRPLALHRESAIARFDFRKDEQQVVDLLRIRKMTLEDILNAGVGHERVVKLTLYALAITRHLDIGGAGRAPIGVTAKERAKVSGVSEPGAVAIREQATGTPPPARMTPAPESPARAPEPRQSDRGLGIDFSRGAGPQAPAPQAAWEQQQAQQLEQQQLQQQQQQQLQQQQWEQQQQLQQQQWELQQQQQQQLQQQQWEQQQRELQQQQLQQQQLQQQQLQQQQLQQQQLQQQQLQQQQLQQQQLQQQQLQQQQWEQQQRAQQLQQQQLQQQQLQQQQWEQQRAQQAPPAFAAPAFAAGPVPTASTSSPGFPAQGGARPMAQQLPTTPSMPAPQIPSAPPARPSAPVQASAPAAASGPPLSPANQARKQEIEAKAAKIDNENYFEMLDLKTDCTAADIQAAYFKVAKAWHPDRLPAELADVKPLVSKCFAKLNEAYQTLNDATKRAEYLQAVEQGRGTPDAEQEAVRRVVDAALEFQKAEILLKKNDVNQAAELANRAAEADPEQGEYVALSLWIQSLKRGDPPALQEGKTSAFYKDIIDQLDVILKREPNLERALFYRGTLLKRSGFEDKAIRDFRMVSQLNPKNIDAQREMRLFIMRREKKAKDEAGLLGKLFKK